MSDQAYTGQQPPWQPQPQPEPQWQPQGQWQPQEQPPPQWPAPQPPPPSAAQVEPPMPRGNKRRQRITLTVFLVLVAGIFVAIYFGTRHNPEQAAVGDCVRPDGENSVKIVDCSDPQAQYKVVGRVEDKTEIEANINACDAYADTTAVYWSGESGGTGFVLCLAAK
jgi:hypothetical protein